MSPASYPYPRAGGDPEPSMLTAATDNARPRPTRECAVAGGSTSRNPLDVPRRRPGPSRATSPNNRTRPVAGPRPSRDFCESPDPRPLPHPRAGGGPEPSRTTACAWNPGPPPARGYDGFLAKLAISAKVAPSAGYGSAQVGQGTVRSKRQRHGSPPWQSFGSAMPPAWPEQCGALFTRSWVGGGLAHCGAFTFPLGPTHPRPLPFREGRGEAVIGYRSAAGDAV